ncbi:hypothetical protein AVEN_260996-1 [Araneus ventricosus]|uniref:Uncharacterized protein n=1 Tax=Araneus ventricosus TaxID=182803 RepID=A0A4Y2L162_ARAVE|nr:hypothetical protein AVEN_260996-1 [Araneus ventricosus]
MGFLGRTSSKGFELTRSPPSPSKKKGIKDKVVNNCSNQQVERLRRRSGNSEQSDEHSTSASTTRKRYGIASSSSARAEPKGREKCDTYDSFVCFICTIRLFRLPDDDKRFTYAPGRPSPT